MMDIVFLREARRELDPAVGYYNECSIGLGLDLQSRVEKPTRQIAENPARFGFLRDTGFRAARLKRFPYLVVYLASEEMVWIVAVANERRHPDYWRRRIRE